MFIDKCSKLFLTPFSGPCNRQISQPDIDATIYIPEGSKSRNIGLCTIDDGDYSSSKVCKIYDHNRFSLT